MIIWILFVYKMTSTEFIYTLCGVPTPPNRKRPFQIDFVTLTLSLFRRCICIYMCAYENDVRSLFSGFDRWFF